MIGLRLPPDWQIGFQDRQQIGGERDRAIAVWLAVPHHQSPSYQVDIA